MVVINAAILILTPSDPISVTLNLTPIPPVPFKKGGSFHALFSPPFLKWDLGGLKIRLFKNKAPKTQYEPKFFSQN